MLYKSISCYDLRRLVVRRVKYTYTSDWGPKKNSRGCSKYTKAAHLYGKHEFFGLCTKLIDTSARIYTQE